MRGLSKEARDLLVEIIQGLVATLEGKDPLTEGHALRVAHLGREMARKMGITGECGERLELSARLHDLGKVGIPARILSKRGPLDENEWAMVRQHPTIGAEILRVVPVFRNISFIVEAHHERPDGTGYPRGLSREGIPIESAIIAVADAFDAMVMLRSYRKAMGAADAMEEIKRHVGTQFKPAAVSALHLVLKEKEVSHFYGEFSTPQSFFRRPGA